MFNNILMYNIKTCMNVRPHERPMGKLICCLIVIVPASGCNLLLDIHKSDLVSEDAGDTEADQVDYDEPEETVSAHGMRLGGDARKWVGVLFPNQHPMLGSWDHF